MRLTQKDIYYLVAKDTNISQDKVEFVIKQMWSIVRGYITNPLTSQLGVRINQLVRFELHHPSVKKKLDSKNLSEDKMNFYKQLKHIINERWQKNKH
jgi:hypothetical protein